MKKFLAALMAATMLISGAALAEEAAPSILESDPAVIATLDRASNVTTWEGKWKLTAAYISEDFIDEFAVEGVEAGLLPVKENAAELEITTILDGSANDPALGTIVDQGAYLHCHVYDMAGTLTFAPEFNEEKPYELSSAWDEWAYVVRGEMDGDFNNGPAKTHIKGDDETLHWAEITGVEIEDMEEMKYITMNTSGHLMLCYAEKNLTKEQNNEIGLAYIFERVAE